MNLSRTSYALTLTTMSLVCAVVNWTLGLLKKKINLLGILVMGGVLTTVSMVMYSKAKIDIGSYHLLMCFSQIIADRF